MAKAYCLIRYFWVAFAGFDDSLRLFVPHAQGERGKNDVDSPAYPVHSLRSQGSLGAGWYNLSAAGRPRTDGKNRSGRGCISHERSECLFVRACTCERTGTYIHPRVRVRTGLVDLSSPGLE